LGQNPLPVAHHPLAVLANHSHRPARLPASFIPTDLSVGMRFQNQCAHWWRKHFRWSARRPEIPQDFRRAQVSS